MNLNLRLRLTKELIESDTEVKRIIRVRTAAGARRYGQPIGSIVQVDQEGRVIGKPSEDDEKPRRTPAGHRSTILDEVAKFDKRLEPDGSGGYKLKTRKHGTISIVPTADGRYEVRYPSEDGLRTLYARFVTAKEARAAIQRLVTDSKSIEELRIEFQHRRVMAFKDADGKDAEEVDVTEDLNEEEIQQLFDAMDKDDFAEVDRITAAVEGRVPFPSDGEPTGSDKAGGADRNRGNAEVLRRYWTVGRGATKIRWGPHSGSFTRCVQHLSKYLGPRAKGYCALRMKETIGVWPGSHINRGD